MSRFVPHPWLTLALVLMWLVLTSFSLGNLVLGAIIALVAGWAMGSIEPHMIRIHRPHLLIKLFFVVFADIVKSNIAVVQVILGREFGRRHAPGFVEIPLRISQPAGLAILAMIATATPGTAWIDYDPESGVLLLHVLDLSDGTDWPALFRDRYESLLLEILA